MHATVVTIRVAWSRILRRLNEAMEARARAASATTEVADPQIEPPIELTTIEPSDPEPRRGQRWPRLPMSDRFRVRWWRYRGPALAFAAGIGGVALLGAWFLRPQYQAASVIAVQVDGGRGWQAFIDEGRGADVEEQMRSRAVLEPVLRELGLFPLPTATRLGWLRPAPDDHEDLRALQRILQDFRGRLRVERLRRSSMLSVAVTADDPFLAARSANAVATSFIEFHRGQAIQGVERKIAALDEEIAAVQSELDTLTVLRSEVLVDDTLLEELVRQLAGADTHLSQALSRYKEQSPTVQQAQREKRALEAILRERIIERRMQLKDHIEQNEQPLSAAREPAAVTLDAAIAQATQRYRDLLTQRAETHLSLTMWKQPSNSFDRFSILDPALPPPARSRLLLILFALLNAALLALGSLLLIPWALGQWDAHVLRPGSLPYRVQRRWDRVQRDLGISSTDPS
jgi:hypothetical protein